VSLARRRYFILNLNGPVFLITQRNDDCVGRTELKFVLNSLNVNRFLKSGFSSYFVSNPPKVKEFF